MTRGIRIGLFFGLLASASTFGQDAEVKEKPEASGTTFALSVNATTNVSQAAGGDVAVGSVARVEYRLERKEDSAEITLDQLGLKITQDGNAVQDSTLARNSFQARPGPGKPVVAIPYDKAPPGLKELLAVFGETAVRLTLDPANGKETARDFRIKGPLAETFRGMVDNILAIHVRVPEDADRWESPARIALAQGQAARGTLAFEKVKPGEGPLVTVKVSGTLTAEGVIGAAKVKDGSFAVTGEQVYDTAAKAWRSARWSVRMEYRLTDPDDKPTGAVKGPLTLTMGAPKDVPVAD